MNDEMMNVLMLYIIMNVTYNDHLTVVDIPGFKRQLNEDLVGLIIHHGKINIMNIEVK
jgi:hypothetical protein